MQLVLHLMLWAINDASFLQCHGSSENTHMSHFEKMSGGGGGGGAQMVVVHSKW